MTGTRKNEVNLYKKFEVVLTYMYLQSGCGLTEAVPWQRPDRGCALSKGCVLTKPVLKIYQDIPGQWLCPDRGCALAETRQRLCPDRGCALTKTVLKIYQDIPGQRLCPDKGCNCRGWILVLFAETWTFHQLSEHGKHR